jgi:hypothetical protein
VKINVVTLFQKLGVRGRTAVAVEGARLPSTAHIQPLALVDHSRSFVAADPDRVQNSGRPHPRTPIMRRLHADRGDNPDPGIGYNQRAAKRSLTSDARLDNEPNFGQGTRRTVAGNAMVWYSIAVPSRYDCR